MKFTDGKIVKYVETGWYHTFRSTQIQEVTCDGKLVGLVYQQSGCGITGHGFYYVLPQYIEPLIKQLREFGTYINDHKQEDCTNYEWSQLNSVDPLDMAKDRQFDAGWALQEAYAQLFDKK